MAIKVFEYTKGQVDAAGATLVSAELVSAEPLPDDAMVSALNVINNWRAIHGFPLNTFQKTLHHKARQVDLSCLVAQRIKRLSSIASKLRRFPHMKLSQMQDIGGCRAVVSSAALVESLVDSYRRSDIKHELVRADDYIRKPKPSGYRGVHMIYRYYSDKRATYNGLKIEMQFRSRLQHAWATAVETVGTFIKQALKSSQGETDWLRFFALMGTAIAFRENSPAVPGTPTEVPEFKAELRDYAQRLNVESRLRAFGETIKKLDLASTPKRAHYFLLQLDPAFSSVTIRAYRYDEIEKATSDYLSAERTIANHRPGVDAVLVSVESLESLRRAYPNYFLDTSIFIEAVKQATW